MRVTGRRRGRSYLWNHDYALLLSNETEYMCIRGRGGYGMSVVEAAWMEDSGAII